MTARDSRGQTPAMAPTDGVARNDAVAGAAGVNRRGQTPAVSEAAMAAGTLSAREVQSMFDRIAPVYDAMNRLMTMGLDLRWRRIAARAVVRPGDRVLDACCGTGDLALACARAGGTVTGLDFAPRMLERARRKLPDATWAEGDLLALPYGGEFDVVTVGFGIRNVSDLGGALREMRRVLAPGGRVAVLEITRPRGPLAPFYRVWFDRIVPLLGKALKGGGAYSYLPASVRRFPGPDDLAGLMAASGFADVSYRTFAGGIVALHIGRAA